MDDTAYWLPCFDGDDLLHWHCVCLACPDEGAGRCMEAAMATRRIPDAVFRTLRSHAQGRN